MQQVHEWRGATVEDIGRLARFADCEGDDWCFGMLVSVEDGIFYMMQMENTETESFFYCEVQQ